MGVSPVAITQLAQSVRHSVPKRGEVGGTAAGVCPLGAHQLAGLGKPGEHLVGPVRERSAEIYLIRGRIR